MRKRIVGLEKAEEGGGIESSPAYTTYKPIFLKILRFCSFSHEKNAFFEEVKTEILRLSFSKCHCSCYFAQKT